MAATIENDMKDVASYVETALEKFLKKTQSSSTNTAATATATTATATTTTTSSTSSRGMKGRKVPPAISTNKSNAPKTITMTSEAHWGLDDSGNYIYSPILMYDDSNCNIEINVIEPGTAPFISQISGNISIKNVGTNTWISIAPHAPTTSTPSGTFSPLANASSVATNSAATQSFSISNSNLQSVSLTYSYDVVWYDGVKNVTTTLPKSSFDNTFSGFPHNK